MQRTVKSTRFTYAKVTINSDGTTATELQTVEVPETNETKAYKRAVKKVGIYFTPLKMEVVENVYVLEDEIFFKYAHIVDKETAEG